MSGNQISETAHSTYDAPHSTIGSRKTGHPDPRDGPSTIAVTPPWFEVADIVEKILSYVDEPVDIARAEQVNRTFHLCSWRVTKDFRFFVSDEETDSVAISGPFSHFGKAWEPSEMAKIIQAVWMKCNVRSLNIAALSGVSGTTDRVQILDDLLGQVSKLQGLTNRKIEKLEFGFCTVLSPVLPPVIELCSESLTTLVLEWGSDADPGDAAIHPTISRAVGRCQNLKCFRSMMSPNGIGKVGI